MSARGALRLALSAALLTPAQETSAQGTAPYTGAFRAVGLVRDSAGAPIAGATISSPDARAETDTLGRFSLRLTRVDSTTITVRRLGFESVTFTMLTDSLALNDLEIQLHAVARTLPGIAIEEERVGRVPTLEQFAVRRQEKEGLGFFLSREEILRREGAPLSSLLSQAQGVRIVRQGNRSVLRFTRWSSRGACAPRVWLDGVPVKGFEIDDVRATDVEALELYPSASSAPAEFSTSEFSCGIVAIWTRRPILRTP